jgi:hypothetical protein
LRFLSLQIVDVLPERPLQELELFVLLGGHHRFALQLDEGVEPPFTINEKRGPALWQMSDFVGS